MKCKTCKKECKRMKHPNPVIKGKYLNYHYCKKCEEGETFTPWHSRE